VGGDSPITVQTMTNTLTTRTPTATIAQIRRCEEAGVDIVRVSCPDEESTAALPKIVRAAKVPIVADIHFHYRAPSRRPRRAPPACGSTPATSATPKRVARWSRPPRTTAVPCASA
jgi:(E)-4-hydroxy-3-methylbut-2-enyl-diphosphate synthase